MDAVDPDQEAAAPSAISASNGALSGMSHWVLERSAARAGAAASLEPDEQALAAIERSTWDFVRAFVDTREAAPAARPQGGHLLAADLGTPPPEVGRGFDAALERFGAAVGRGLDVTAPGFMAYVPGGAQVVSAVAALLGSLVNPFVGQPDAAPGMIAIENSVLRWLCREFGLPADASMGIFTSGGSLSALTAFVAARETLLGGDTERATVYVASESHGSALKAARAAGFDRAALRVLPCRAADGIDPAVLATAIAADRRAGWRPAAIVASAGTTNTGAVDPLRRIGELARREGLWLHVDACYGGPFQLTERGRALFDGIELADSIAVDPHKGMYTPFGCGCLLVRDGATLRAAFGEQLPDEYLKERGVATPAIPDFAEHSLELTRPFRGLLVWLPLQVHGVATLRQSLDEKLDLAAELAERLAALPGIEVLGDPSLSVVCFRPVSAHGDDGPARALLAHLNASGSVYLSGTTVDGRFALRACVLNHRTHRPHVARLVDLVADAVGRRTDTAA